MAILRTFGKNPSGEALEKITSSVNYRDGLFQNLSPTESLAKGVNFPRIMWRFFNKPKNTAPPEPLPSVKTDLRSLSREKPFIVWFGHSSYLIGIDGFNILVDPVFSGHASPFSFTGKNFKGSNVYAPDDMPAIDLLIITHDHYDHLDYSTVRSLDAKITRICTSTGVGSHLRYWGMDPAKITELDWWDRTEISTGESPFKLTVVAAPARHFSGRSFVRNKTLWSSFILSAGDYRLYLGADSGYDSHFKMIGEKFGPFDIAMLECGQYNEWWPYIHMMPEQTVQAAIDLKAKILMPVHWGKFALGLHPWDEPIKRAVAKAHELNVPVATPMIGEPVILDRIIPKKQWWLGW